MEEEEEQPKKVAVKKDSLISVATAAADRLEKANAEARELLQRKEELMARELLQGKAQAGSIPKEKSEEEKRREFITEAFKGTGTDPFKNQK